MQLFTKSTGSASEWFLSTIYLSLVVGLFATVGHAKKAVIPTPGLLLFRLIIYVENIENLTYIASTKKPGYPHFFKKTGDIVSREALDFSRRLPRGRMVADKKEQGFQGFGHLGKPFDSQLCVCGTIIL